MGGFFTNYNEKRIEAKLYEKPGHRFFRNVCAMITIIIAFYFLYVFFDFHDVPEDMTQFSSDQFFEISESDVTDIGNQAFAEVLSEDYGISLPSLPSLPSLSFFLCVLCVVCCFLANRANGAFVLPFYRSSVIATGVAIGANVLSSTLFVRPMIRSLVIVYHYLYAGSIYKGVVDYDPLSTNITIAKLIIGTVLGFLPAFIARRKNYSFVLFFLLSIPFFLPVLIITIIMKDKYENEMVSGRALTWVLRVIVFVFSLKTFGTFVLTKAPDVLDAMLEFIFPGILEVEEYTPEVIISLAIVFAIIAVPPTLLAFWIPALLSRPIEKISSMVKPKKKTVGTYCGVNAEYVNQITEALPAARKYKFFYKRRDRLASFREFDIDKAMGIAVPATYLFTLLFRWANFLFGKEIFGVRGIFPFRIYGYGIIIVFALFVLLSKPIAILLSKRADRLDRIDKEKGFMREIRENLPSFEDVPDDKIRTKYLCYMRAFYKVNKEELDPRDAGNLAELVKEGVSMTKIVASIGAFVLLAKKLEEKLIEG